ncbi:MAG: IS110 family transposase [Eggerthellaceae bacterium]|jgi:transposase
MAYRTSIGLDVHARSISACALDNITGEISQRSFSQPVAQDIIDWASGFEGPVRAVYETGPTGFTLARQLNASGLECVVGATSKMLRPSGDRVKNDRRDALLLARMLSTGNIPEVAIPDAEQEAAKDLVRMREDAREALTASKLRLAHFLIRKGHVYEKGKKTWTRAYEDWLRGLSFDTELDRAVFDELLAKVRSDTDRRDRIQKLVEKEAGSERWSPMVARLSCMKGISTYTAFALAVEIGDFGRFPNARAFQSYVGLLATENSSGEKVRSGGITKTGNCLVRKLLTEASWLYLGPRRLNPSISVEGPSPEVIEHARKGCIRLKRRAQHLQARGKKGCIVVTAISRELAGWVWALATM